MITRKRCIFIHIKIFIDGNGEAFYPGCGFVLFMMSDSEFKEKFQHQTKLETRLLPTSTPFLPSEYSRIHAPTNKRSCQNKSNTSNIQKAGTVRRWFSFQKPMMITWLVSISHVASLPFLSVRLINVTLSKAGVKEEEAGEKWRAGDAAKLGLAAV